MNAKQIVVGALITCLFIVPKEFLFKPENFWLNMLLNVFGFLLGAVAGSLLFRNKTEEKISNEKPKIVMEEKPLPAATKVEDYKNFMPK